MSQDHRFLSLVALGCLVEASLFVATSATACVEIDDLAIADAEVLSLGGGQARVKVLGYTTFAAAPPFDYCANGLELVASIQSVDSVDVVESSSGASLPVSWSPNGVTALSCLAAAVGSPTFGAFLGTVNSAVAAGTAAEIHYDVTLALGADVDQLIDDLNFNAVNGAAFVCTGDATPSGDLLTPALTDITPVDASAATMGDNGRILFTSNRDGNAEIYDMQPDGSDQRRLTVNSAVDEEPSASPDGLEIAFTSLRDGNSEIYTMNSDGSGQTNRTNNAATDDTPAWSPDGSEIAFRSDRDGNFEIYKMNADGTGQTRLTNNPATECCPTWSPDSARIAFHTDRDGNFEIYEMNADGSGQTNLTNNSASDARPDWSPDGVEIAFESDRDGNVEVYTMNESGSGQTRLTFDPGFDSSASWSPDGTQIAFFTTRSGNLEIFTMNADGSSPTNRSANPAADTLPDWQVVPVPEPRAMILLAAGVGALVLLHRCRQAGA